MLSSRVSIGEDSVPDLSPFPRRLDDRFQRRQARLPAEVPARAVGPRHESGGIALTPRAGDGGDVPPCDAAHDGDDLGDRVPLPGPQIEGTGAARPLGCGWPITAFALSARSAT